MEQWKNYKKWASENGKKESDSNTLKEYLALDFQSTDDLPQYEQDLLALLVGEKGDWLSVEYIQWRLDHFKPTTTNKHNCGGRSLLRQAIRSLRLNESVNWIIISSPLGYKIPNEYEAHEFVESLKVQALKKLKLYWTTQKKLNKHNQYQFKHEAIEEVIAVLERGNYGN